MQDRFKQASAPHELLMINLAVFHLLFPVAALSSGHVLLLLTISLAGSASIIGLLAWRARHPASDDALIISHKRLAWKRCKLLLLGYLISLAIILLGWLFSSFQVDHNMANIMLVVFSRIAAVPTVLIMLALFIMETTALSEARQGKTV